MSEITDNLNRQLDITAERFNTLHGLGQADHARNIAILRDELAAIVIAVQALDARIDELTTR